MKHPECRAPHLEDSLERLRTRVDEMISEERAVMERQLMKQILRFKRGGGRLPGPWPYALAALAVVSSAVAGFVAGWCCRG